MRQTFVHVDAFVAEFGRLGMTDGDLTALEAEIGADPAAAPVVAGTGGLRKLRFAPPFRHAGKRGGLRVASFWFPRFATVYLLQAFQKKDLANLTAAQKQRAKAVAERFETHLERLATEPVKRLKR